MLSFFEKPTVFKTLFGEEPVKFINIFHFTTYFLPRLTFVIFIEIFAFYFLRLYKLSLQEAHFYQNELTAIEFKLIALKTALLLSKDNQLDTILNEFVKIDNNKVIKQGETTAEIEKYKAENNYSESIISKLSEVMRLILGKKEEDKTPKPVEDTVKKEK
jgi:hypothetical protein